MTNKEAIRRILDHKRVHSLNEPRAVLINEALDLAIKALEDKPQGEWVAREDMDYLDKNKVVHKHFECNKCGFIHDFIDGHTSQYSFCPNCGADLRKDGSCEMTDPQCVDYLENICKLFVNGSKNCEGQALEYQQVYISAIRHAIAKLQSESDMNGVE